MERNLTLQNFARVFKYIYIFHMFFVTSIVLFNTCLDGFYLEKKAYYYINLSVVFILILIDFYAIIPIIYAYKNNYCSSCLYSIQRVTKILALVTLPFTLLVTIVVWINSFQTKNFPKECPFRYSFEDLSLIREEVSSGNEKWLDSEGNLAKISLCIRQEEIINKYKESTKVDDYNTINVRGRNLDIWLNNNNKINSVRDVKKFNEGKISSDNDDKYGNISHFVSINKDEKKTNNEHNNIREKNNDHSFNNNKNLLGNGNGKLDTNKNMKFRYFCNIKIDSELGEKENINCVENEESDKYYHLLSPILYDTNYYICDRNELHKHYILNYDYICPGKSYVYSLFFTAIFYIILDVFCLLFLWRYEYVFLKIFIRLYIFQNVAGIQFSPASLNSTLASSRIEENPEEFHRTDTEYIFEVNELKAINCKNNEKKEEGNDCNDTNIFKADNIDNIDNKDNINNTDNVDNKDNINIINNTDSNHTDNIDNKDNRENTDNINNLDNTNNTNNLDNIKINDVSNVKIKSRSDLVDKKNYYTTRQQENNNNIDKIDNVKTKAISVRYNIDDIQINDSDNYNLESTEDLVLKKNKDKKDK